MPRAVGVGTPCCEHFSPPTHHAGNWDPLLPQAPGTLLSLAGEGKGPWRAGGLERGAGSWIKTAGLCPWQNHQVGQHHLLPSLHRWEGSLLPHS